MKLDATKFGLAVAIVTAIGWTLCSALVAFVPGPMMSMSGHMMHADMGAYHWVLTWRGFVVGLVLWTVIDGVLGWAIAAVYNKLIDRGAAL